MGSLLLLVVLLLSIGGLINGHLLLALFPWLILGVGAYIRPDYPWGKRGPK